MATKTTETVPMLPKRLTKAVVDKATAGVAMERHRLDCLRRTVHEWVFQVRDMLDAIYETTKSMRLEAAGNADGYMAKVVDASELREFETYVLELRDHLQKLSVTGDTYMYDPVDLVKSFDRTA